MAKVFNYKPDGPVLEAFFWDNSPVTIIQGPIGSGTSTCCMMKMWRIANEQKPGPDGCRRTRWGIVRNTYSELSETTMKTWSFWFEERVGAKYGELKRTRPPNHRIKVPCEDGTRIDMEVIFLALDEEEDIRKLMSMEPTGWFFNEIQFTQKTIFDEGHSRVALGRFPPVIDGGPTWKGIIGDLNAPSEGHWIPYMRGDVAMPLEWDEDTRRQYIKPDDWKFYVQPPGLLEVIENKRVVRYEVNQKAENRKWLSESYLEVIKGKTKEWIDARVMNRVGLYRAGKAVFESFRPEIHITDKPIEWVPEFPLIVGMDFARNPAVLFGQVIRGVIYILSEMGSENTNATTFAPLVKQHLHSSYPGAEVTFWGDPTGGSKGQSTDLTPFQIFGKHGMPVLAAPGNNRLPLRLETIETILIGMVAGVPKLQIDPECRVLKTAMNGGYHYAKIKGTTRHQDTPLKDRFSDYADALQYLALGAGFGAETVAQPKREGARPRRGQRKRFSIRRSA